MYISAAFGFTLLCDDTVAAQDYPYVESRRRELDRPLDSTDAVKKSTKSTCKESQFAAKENELSLL